jgi:hypothetical protein
VARQLFSSEEGVGVASDDLGSSLQHEEGTWLVRRCTKGGNGRSGPALTEMMAATATATWGGAASSGLWQ